ncbi:hypothetical protein CEXT_84181 [Caerostris extrusa]|uniref:TROVE domain-containing protein n=1 Tax=Caerostris extrusa TaxID=172846 RepID=A0AAV4NJ12_CAEEX|nr:hypothetical protein CEXT_84181 [Caerostris extrusa]
MAMLDSDTPADRNLASLQRFLYLGDDFHPYPRSVAYPFSLERTQLIKEFEEKGLESEILKEIKHAYKFGYHLGYEPLIFTLALLGHSSKIRIKEEALKVASEICTSAGMLLTFVHIYKDISKPSKGWGRAHRRFLIRWYNEKDAKDLAKEVTKVKSCHKWTHKDVLCMAHVKAKHAGNAAVLKYLVKGLEVAQKDCGSEPDAVPILDYLKGVYEVCHSTDPENVARLVEVHDLCLEHIPSKLLKSKEVSLCIIPRIPLHNLLELLPQFNKAGLLKPNSPHYRNGKNSNKILPGKPIVRQSTPELDEALQNLHLSSFKNVRHMEKHT